MRALYCLMGALDPSAGDGFRTVQETVWNGTFGGRFADRQEAIRLFTQHTRDVEASVPAERLLIFDVKQGWEPLCDFLGVPVPTGEPFPHVNDAADFDRRQRGQYLTILRRLAPALLALAAVGVLLLAGIKRRREKRSARG